MTVKALGYAHPEVPVPTLVVDVSHGEGLVDM